LKGVVGIHSLVKGFTNEKKKEKLSREKKEKKKSKKKGKSLRDLSAQKPAFLKRPLRESMQKFFWKTTKDFSLYFCVNFSFHFLLFFFLFLLFIYYYFEYFSLK